MQEAKLQPRHRAASVDRQIGKAIAYGIVAFVCVVLLFVFDATNIWIWLIFFIPALFAGRMSYRHFKHRYTGQSALTAVGDKAPVLYLRPFEQDDGWDGATPFALYDVSTWTWRKMLIVTPTNLTALYLQMTGRLSFEQVLAFVVRKIGPMVAIGEPGSPPIFGAHNVYVGDDNWQHEVHDLARRSRLIVLTAGVSEGVLWEVRTMTQEVPPDRFLLVIPGKSRGIRRDAYELFQLTAADLFPGGLPETVDGARFLAFDAAWQPLTGKRPAAAKHSPVDVGTRLARLLA